MPSDRGFKIMDGLHRAVLKVTGGRAGRKVSGMPLLELTTTGRKTGKPHAVLLTSPVQEDGTLVIVASKMGSDHHPAWFLNLEGNPDVEVAFPYPAEAAERMRARVAEPEERARLWPQVTDAYQGYAKYQDKTAREIPLVLLTPVP